MKKFNSWYCMERIGVFESLQEAQDSIYSHLKYKKSLFTKKGRASSNNPNPKESFSIYDNEGFGWHIR